MRKLVEEDRRIIVLHRGKVFLVRPDASVRAGELWKMTLKLLETGLAGEDEKLVNCFLICGTQFLIPYPYIRIHPSMVIISLLQY